ncbi:ATP-binding cassette domain-containing protein [bacterium]|nr:ATP-binding cassette domain-containing protein [bacterium]
MLAQLIDLQNISVGFPQKTVLEGLSLQVDKGSLVLIEGATGSGKTTLISLLSGGLGMQAGFGRVVGFDLPGISPYDLTAMRRRLGIVFQSPRFLDQETVLTNVSLPLAIIGTSRSECRSRGTRALMDANLASQARRLPSELSGGEKARLQIARALIHRPFLLLADEPFAHLDSESAAAAEALITKAHARGTTVLVTTHQPTKLAKTAIRYSMENGALYSC